MASSLRGMLLLVVMGSVACSRSGRGSHPTPSDFSLSTSAVIGLRPASEGPLAVALSRTGPAQAVTISVAGLPAGVTADPLTLAETSSTGSITFHVAASATPGDFFPQILASSASVSHVADIRFVVRGAPGTLDVTFGTMGISTAGSAQIADGGPEAAAADSDGSVALVVQSLTHGLNVVEYTTGGLLASSFGSNGKVRVPDADYYSVTPGSVAFAGAHRVTIAGTLVTPHDWVIQRYDASGALDATLGTAGQVSFDVLSNGADDDVFGLVLDTAGRLAVSGYSFPNSGPNVSVVGRFDSAGELDSTFDGGAGFLLDTSLRAGPLARAASGGYWVSALDADLAVLALDATGSPITSFGTQGVSISAAGGMTAVAQSIGVLDDGTVIVGGCGSSNAICQIVSFDPVTGYDSSFAGSGALTITNDNASIATLPLADHGFLLASADASGPFLRRYTDAGALDPAFTEYRPAGQVTPNSVVPSLPFRSLLIAGYRPGSPGVAYSWLARVWN